MQIAETKSEGLERAYRLTIPAAEIEARVDGEVKKMAPQVRMPGFRPGKVPPNLVKRMHRDALMQEALNSSIQEGIEQAISEAKLRPATQPHVHLDHDYAPGKDAVADFHFEVLPDVPTPQIEGLTLERLTVEPSQEEIDEALGRIASGNKRFEPADEGHAARQGDLVVIDFVGKVDGTPFEGGTGEAMSVELGSGQLIPGFEDQLVGVKAGEERTLEVSFPADYNVESLKGKPATFDVVVKEVRVPADSALDDDFAKSLGLESLEQLIGLVKGQLEQELNGLTRTHMKRQLLDRLAATHDFPVPPTMVEAEFQQIWEQLEKEAANDDDPDKARAEIESERDEYRRIAERRVRLGLLLSEIGQVNGVEVSQQEMNMLIQQAAQQYRPEDRQKFMDYLRQTPMAAAQLRAPLFEDKVVDWLFDKSQVSERSVTREELQAAIEAEEGAAVPAEAKPKKKAAKPAAKGEEGEAGAKPKRAAAKKGGKAAEEASSNEASAPAPAKKPARKKAEGAPAEEAQPKPKRASKPAAAQQDAGSKEGASKAAPKAKAKAAK